MTLYMHKHTICHGSVSPEFSDAGVHRYIKNTQRDNVDEKFKQKCELTEENI